MVITEDIKGIITGAAVITLVTVNADGTPHPIIAGKGEVEGDKVIFGIYKMVVTQENIKKNNKAWVVAGTMDQAPKGCRLAGTAVAQEKKLIFTASKAEELI
ncbi:MAG: pyridoxamine 5'-phosphate oxidase family protein [Treponema sp.]|jgi:general stress protein 26|nr:pyridoxamine 5'-phosphate oxidase family protein [Treponema sp.]